MVAAHDEAIFTRAHAALFTIVALLRLALAALVPIIQDETYYLA